MPYTRDIKSGNNVYRYEVTSYWDKEKKSPRQRVKYLGKVVKDLEGKEKILRKHFVVDSFEKSMPVGELAAYFRIATNLELRGIINECCPKSGPEPGIPILLLAFNQLINRYSLSRVGDWFETSPLPKWFETELKITKDVLLGALDSLRRVESGKVTHYGWKVQQEIVNQWKDHYGMDNQRLYYDITRLRYYGITCSLAEKGRKSRGDGKEIGVALVTSQKSCFPVMCRPIPGAKHDSITVKDVINALWSWGIRGVMLIMDRGMVSTPNLRYAVKKGYDLLLGGSETSIDVLREMSRWSDEELMEPENIFEWGEKKFVYLKSSKGQILGVGGKSIIVLDPVRLAGERTARDWMLKELKSPDTSEERKEELRKRLEKEGLSHDLGDFQSEESMAGLHGYDLVKRRDGRFLLFSTKKSISEVNAFRWYFQKDEIEKAFRSLNNEVNLIPVRYRIPERIEAYLTVNFIAYLLLAAVQHNLRLKKDKRSVSEVMYEARKITQIEFVSKGKTKSTLVQPTHLQQKVIDLLEIRDPLPKT
jgi:transposase